MTISLYIEEQVGEIRMGFRYYPNTGEYECLEAVGHDQYVTAVDEGEVTQNIKKAFAVYLEGEV